jgi:hypothetical protein
MNCITRGSWLRTRAKRGLQFSEAKVLAINFAYTGNWNDFSRLGRKLGLAKKGKWWGGLNILLQEKNIGETLLERTSMNLKGNRNWKWWNLNKFQSEDKLMYMYECASFWMETLAPPHHQAMGQ